MSAARKVQPLTVFFAVSALSAVAAWFLRVPVAGKAAPLLKGQDVVSPGLIAYALVFAAAFAVFSFLSHRVSLRFSLKATGLEKARGLAPRIARAVLAAAIFAVPLLLSAPQGGKSGPSLKSLIAASDRRAASGGAEQGYKNDERGKLHDLMGSKP
jgi:hypothetical protein